MGNILSMAFLFGSAIAFGADGRGKVDSEESIQKLFILVKDANPSLQVHKLARKLAQNRLQDAKAAYWPTFGFDASIGLGDQVDEFSALAKGNTQDQWTSKVALKLQETLYNNGLNHIEHQQAKMELALVQLEQDFKLDELFSQVLLEFLHWSRQSALLEAEKQQQSLLKQQFLVTEEMHNQGLRSRKDYLRMQAQMNRSQLNLIHQQSLITAALEKLAVTTGQKIKNLPPLQAVKPKRQYQLAALQPIDTNSHKATKIQQLKEKLHDLKVRKARKENGPNLSVSAGAGWGITQFVPDFGPVEDDDYIDWSIQVDLKIPIWDFGQRKRKLENELTQKQITRLNHKAKTLELEKDINVLFRDYQAAYDRYALSIRLYDLEEENLAVLRNEYQRGKMTFLDLKDALDNLINSRIGFIEAFFSLRVLEAKYLYHRGDISHAYKNH